MKNYLSAGILTTIVYFLMVASVHAQLASSSTDQGAIRSDFIDPGSQPAVFLQEGVPVPNGESAPTFMPDGNTVYLADNDTIRFSKLVNGKWTKPVVAPFSGHWNDWDPFVSPDGKRLVFVSNRPLPGTPQDKPQKNNQLWYVDRLFGDEWSKPQHFDAPVNIDGANDYGPSLSSSGTLCFCSRRDGNKGMGGYYTKWLGDHYEKPQQLLLNGTSDIFDPFISPDESYIIFGSNKNLYISYRHNGEWSAGQKLASNVNNGNYNGGPYVSPDGKMLYYAQEHAPGILMIPVHLKP
jgi:Tol biopolymer transport system component